MKQSLLLAAPLLLLALAACDGSTGTVGQNTLGTGQPALQTVTYGRLVDIYAYQRVDEARGDRRDQLNRRRVLIQTDVVVRSNIETQSLYDPAGEVVQSANYQFMPFDVNTGHEELLILWDNRGEEQARFEAALTGAQLNLAVLPPSYRGQNTSQQPIPVVPRDAAIVLNFSAKLNLTAEFFEVNPSAVQLLEFAGDPNVISPTDAFRSIPYRVVTRGSQLILDPTIEGGEARGGFTASGMPASLDRTTANIRIALPSRGSVSSAFYVQQESIDELNDLDSFGRDSVIRDFRSGNQNDGAAGVLRDFEPPMILGTVGMGISDIAADGTITLNKRSNLVPIRARFPFVGGAIDRATNLVLGPASVPTSQPLRAGDTLLQTVTVQLPDGTTENVRIRAEIMQNLDVGTYRGDPAFPGLGLAVDGSQGSSLPITRVKVGEIRGVDSLGRPVTFQANAADPLGQDCSVRRLYYENIRFSVGTEVVSDVGDRFNYLKVEPAPPASVGGIPVPPGQRVDPNASIALEFSEPMDFERIDATRNLVLTNSVMTGTLFFEQLNQPKVVSSSVVPARLSDQAGDGTLLQLKPPMGFFHSLGSTSDIYWFHLLLGSDGLTDFSGNPVFIANDDPSNTVNNWSAQLTMDQDKQDNLVLWHVYPFESADEDGTASGSVDLFGQFRLLDGRLVAAEAVRFRRTADNNNLGSISRTNRGECGPAVTTFVPANGGRLYWTPRMLDTVQPPNVPNPYEGGANPQPVGQVIEPHQPRGSRMQMRYLEDDFGLSNRQASDMVLDVEQLYWSPFADFDVRFDVFDRYSMALGHADKRPDTHWTLVPGAPPAPDRCVLDCLSMNSGLTTNYADNILRGSSTQSVFEDKIYRIDPNDQFRSPDQIKFISYPRFDRTYTWRDSRLVTKQDGATVGLGGARNPQPATSLQSNDWTADVDSPWVPSVFPNPAPVSGSFVLDEGDFRGNRRRDLDPIAMPILVDFKMFPDGAANTIAQGVNGFQVAMIGQPSGFALGNPGGYYDANAGIGCATPTPTPMVRVHTTGGLNPSTLADILIDPANQISADGGWIKDSGAIILTQAGLAGNGPNGIVRAPAGDGMLHWAAADFVRRVSTVTFGFFDTKKPNQRVGAAVPGGFPDVTAAGFAPDLAISDFTSLLDPPLAQQPAGTSIVFEIRGANDFANDDVLYNPGNNDTVAARGNLLNPNYACEAYRYAEGNSGTGFTSPRVLADGLTAYVTQDRLDTIRNPLTGLLPRYMNFRLVMTNNIDVTPAISPSLKSMSVVYRVRRP